MENYIVPLLFFIVMFVGFGLSQRGRNKAGGCADCTGESCSSKGDCSKD